MVLGMVPPFLGNPGSATAGCSKCCGEIMQMIYPLIILIVFKKSNEK